MRRFILQDSDGAIQQVVWSVDQQGFATTQVSRNTELKGRDRVSYRERRFFERVKDFVRKAEVGELKRSRAMSAKSSRD